VSAGFLNELRRRRVLPVAGAYLAIGWLITEIAGFLLGQAGAPAWSVRLLALAFVGGFPVAVVAAWMIRRGPGGGLAPDSSRGQMRTLLATLAAGAVVTAVLAWLVLPRVAEPPSELSWRPMPDSLAIVPFDASGGTPNQRVVAETLYTALLEGLNRSRELAQVRLQPDVSASDPLALGRRVRVAALLFGRVSPKAGGTRVDLELLDVVRGTSLWSRSFDWDATRVIETGASIANDVLGSLELTPLSQDRFAGTDDREAYDALLLGHRNQRSFNADRLRAAMDDFQRAIDLDPGFVDAYVGLAQTIFVYLNIKGPAETERQALTERRRDVVETAFRLDEDHPDTLSLMGMLAENHELQVQMYERALELDPDSAQTYFRLAWARLQEANVDEGERLIRRALEYDPHNANYRSDLASVLWDLGRYDEARRELERSIGLDPRMAQNYQKLAAWNMFHYGRIDEAIINLREAFALDPEDGYTAGGIGVNYRHLGMKEEAFAWMEHSLELSPTSSWIWVMAAAVHKSFADREGAMAYYRRSLELAPGLTISLRELGFWDIRNERWGEARRRWGEAYPELVHPDDPVVTPANIDAALWYSANLKQAGYGEEANRLIARCREVVAGLPPDSDLARTVREFLPDDVEPDPEQMLRDLREAIVERRKRAEIDLSRPEFDPIRQRPEFEELARILEDDLAWQRERLRELERNGQLPPAPGVVLIER